MPSVTYMNQSAPFWDFIASLEQQQDRSSGDNNNNDSQEHANEHHSPPGPPPFGPWGGWGRGFPFRPPPPPPHHGPGHHPHGPPPPPPGHHHPHGQPPPPEHEHPHHEKSDLNEKGEDNGEGPSNTSGSDNENHRPHGRGRCGGRKGRHGWGPYGRGGHHHGGRGGWGGWGSWGGGRGGAGAGGGFDPFSFAANLFNPENFDAAPRNESTDDHTPDADIFDTSTAFVVHVSLAGAKKEDVGVNWDEGKSELSIAGVIYRPGDEEFLKTLAMDERKVGAFERKIRLGTRANPASIDAEGITAKLEDGVLRVEVPKRLEDGFVEVRKVDVE